MVGLPPLVFGTEIEGAGMLQVGWEHDRLVPGLTGQLDAQIPRVKGDKGKLEVFWSNVLSMEVVETLDSVSKTPGVADLIPGEGCQTGCKVRG